MTTISKYLDIMVDIITMGRKIFILFIIFLWSMIIHPQESLNSSNQNNNNFKKIDLTKQDIYIRKGFQENWIHKLPSQEERKDWKLIKGGQPEKGLGNRTIRIVDLDFKDVPKRAAFSFKKYKEQTFTFLTSFNISKKQKLNLKSR